MDIFSRYCLIVLLVGTASLAYSRPELIRAGVPYYSDEYFQQGVVRDIESEKNYEEIYKFYTYYEVIYDSDKRVTVFREYKRGDLIYEEHYQYTRGSDDKWIATRSIILQKISP